MTTKEKQRKKRHKQPAPSDVERASELKQFFEALDEGKVTEIGTTKKPSEPYDDILVLGPLPSSELVQVLSGLVPQQSKRRKVTHSRIRVLLNQPLTYAEAEDIKHRGVNFRLTVSPNRQHLWAEGAMDSRRMYRIVAKVIADRYVNYFPRAVRTFSEYTRPFGSQ